MRVALVAPSYLPRPGRLERHVHELARSLARRDADVEVLTQEPIRALSTSDTDGFTVRRFAASVGGGRFALAPGLWEHLRREARSFDVVHAHTGHAAFALAVARARPRRLVFTPHAPIENLLRWPYGPITRAVLEAAAQTICTTAAQTQILRRRFPAAAPRIRFGPPGLDVATIEAATAFDCVGTVVLTRDSLERDSRIDLAIAAMPALAPSFRLVVSGDGPLRQRLRAHAADLGVSSRVEFVGALPDAEQYRWLRTAGVLLSLSEREFSATPVMEALVAGTPVVASDIPAHREAALYTNGGGVTFVSSLASPLVVADGVRDAAQSAVSTGPPQLGRQPPTWEDVSEAAMEVYAATIAGTPPPAVTTV